MEIEEKLRVLESKEKMAFDILADVKSEDMLTDEFQKLMDACQKISFAINHLRWAEKEEQEKNEAPNPAEAPTPEAPKAETPAPVPAPVAPTGMSKTEVRTKLAHLKSAGVEVAKIMHGMGWQNLTAVPADQYQALLDACEEAKE